MEALGFDLTVMRAASRARAYLVDSALSQVKSVEQANVVLLRMGLEL
jgi:hypothetical protein